MTKELKTPKSTILYGAILCLALGMLSGGLSNSGPSDWYLALAKPGFTPPSWVFGPAWTILYILIGCAAGIIWHHRKKNPALFYLFIAQLIFNFSWSFIFFGAHHLLWAAIDIILLWLTILLVIIKSIPHHKAVAWLLTPYLAWVSFATVLNITILLIQ